MNYARFFLYRLLLGRAKFAAIPALLLGTVRVEAAAPRTFTLQASSTDTQGHFEAVVSFRREASFSAPRTIDLPPDIAAECGSASAGILATAPNSESFLLAFPGATAFDPSDWSATISGTKGALPGVNFEPVIIGNHEGVQVTVPFDAVPSTGSLTVTGPPANLTRSRTKHGNVDAAANLFLNSHDSEPRHRSRARGTPSPPPQPPGAVRISWLSYTRIPAGSSGTLNDDNYFLGGDEIFSLPLSSLGITAGQILSVAFIHQTDVLPVGGIIGGNVLDLYAPQHNTLSDQHDAIFLNTAPSIASGTISTRSPFLTLAPASTEVALPRSRSYAPNNQYERFISEPVGERFGMHRVQNPAGGGYPATQTQSIAIPDQLTSTSVGVTATLYGINTDPGTNPDHTANLKVQGISLPAINWDGQTSTVASSTATFASIPAAPAIISLQHDAAPGKPNGDFQLIDGVTLTWTGYPRIDATNARAVGRVTLAADGGGQPRRITLGGFPAGTTAAQVLLLDVTNPVSPIRVVDPPTFTDGSGTVAIEFEAPAMACVFHAQRIATLQTPAIAAASTMPSPLPGGTELKGIYVRPPSVAAALAPLLAHRGAGYIELDPQSAYDNYGNGQESPEAIRSAIKYLVENSPDSVSFPLICLVGHGTFDRRDYMNRQSGAQVPPFVFQAVPTTVGTIENSDDYDYGLIAGNDLLCDAVVARFPIRTSAELTNIVNRIIAYDNALPTLRTSERRALFAFDNDSTFQSDISTWQSEWNTATGKGSVATSLASASTSTVQFAIKNEMERTGTNMGVPIRGDILAMYFGHGNYNTWAGEGIVTVAGGNSVPTINTANQWPFVMTYTCLNHQYALPLTTLGPCLGESWMTTSGRGAVVSVAPGGFDAYSVQRGVALEVLDQLKLPPGTRPRTVGLTHTLAMNAYLAQFPFRLTTIQGYTYFGDGEADWSLDAPGAGVDDALWRTGF